MPREMRLYIPGEIQVRNVVYSAIWISITFDLGERRAVQIIHRVGIASVSRKCRRSVGNINPQVSVYLVRVCVRQLSSQISFVDGSEKRSGDRERITVRGDRAGQGLFEQVVIQSATTAARRWAGSISADACNAEKVQLCRDHPHTVYRF